MSVADDFYSLFDHRTEQATVNGTPVPINGHGHAYALAALRGEANDVSNAREGTRNDTLNAAWFKMGRHVGAGTIDLELVRTTLSDAARMAGLPEIEIGSVLRDDESSGATAGALNPRHPTELDIPPVTVLDLNASEEDSFWAARTILTHVHTFARARMVSPWAVLGVTLARVLVATPNQVCLPPIVGGRQALNIFVGLVGPSGSGKGAAEAVASEAVNVGDVRSARIASGEAIAHVYKVRVRGNPEPEWRDDTHAALIQVAEIDRLAGMSERRGSTIMADLRSAWSGETLGQVAADSTRSIPLEANQYRLCLVAGIQPTRASCLLDDSDGGTPQRFLWMPTTDPGAPDHEPETPKPISWSAPRTGPFVGIGGVQVSVCAIAIDTIKDARKARNRGDGDALDGHALLCQLKTAAALGIAEGRYTVTDEDWALAGTIARKSAATRATVVSALAVKAKQLNLAKADAEAGRAVHVGERVAEAGTKAACNVILRRLRKEDDWFPRGRLRNALESAKRQHFEGAIERLVEAGQIEIDTTSSVDRYRVAKEAK